MVNRIVIKEQFKRLDKSGIVYTFLNFFIYGVYFLRALIVPKLLDSYSYGVFSVFNLYLKFSTIFDLGSISYLQKEVAVSFHNTGDYDRKLERQVIFLNTLLVLVSTVVFFLFNRDLTNKLHFLDYVFWISIAASSQWYVIHTGILRSLEKFKVLSKVLLTNALMSVLIVAFFFLNIKNIYLIYSVYLFALFLPLIAFLTKFKSRLFFSLRFLVHSWPIFAYNILFYLYSNIDKFTVKSTFTFLEFSTYSLYSTIVTSIFMAVSLLWSMFYSRIFGKQSDIAEKLDTINALIIFLCVCVLKILYPVFHTLFPNYGENIQFYEVSVVYAALVYFLPNTLIKYLNNKKTLLFVCAVLLSHLCLILIIRELHLFLELLPMLSLLTYFLIEMLGIKSHNKRLFFLRILISILLTAVCIL